MLPFYDFSDVVELNKKDDVDSITLGVSLSANLTVSGYVQLNSKIVTKWELSHFVYGKRCTQANLLTLLTHCSTVNGSLNYY